MPTSFPCLSTTGSLFTQRSSINAAASEIARSGPDRHRGRRHRVRRVARIVLVHVATDLEQVVEQRAVAVCPRAFLDQDVAFGDDPQHGAVVINDRQP